MLVHSLASKYARFVVLVRQIETNVLDLPPPIRPLDPPLLKSDDLFLGNQEILDPPFKNPGHAPVFKWKHFLSQSYFSVILRSHTAVVIYYRATFLFVRVPHEMLKIIIPSILLFPFYNENQNYRYFPTKIWLANLHTK